MTFRLNIDFEEKIMKNGLNFKRYEDNLINIEHKIIIEKNTIQKKTSMRKTMR